MKRLLLALIVLFAVGCQQEPVPEPPVAKESAQPKVEYRTLTALGDSLTEGLGVEPEMAYPAQLERRLQEAGLKWKVVNAGLAGETSSGALTRLDWVLKTKPDAVILVTGANDGLRGVDPALTQQNIDAIVSRLKEQDVAVMLGGMKAPPNLGEDYAGKFEGLYGKVAEKHSIPLIPFFLEGVARDPNLNQDDGKHPTAEGYTVVVERIYPQVESWLKGL